jgi:predicted nucleic acid-binding protein
MTPAIQNVVLDTNVVLDWLLFGNPQCAPLQQALTSSAIRWIATAEMRDELEALVGAESIAAAEDVLRVLVGDDAIRLDSPGWASSDHVAGS